jgi:hypothetical protein
MALNEPICSINDEHNKVVDVECSCDFLWSLAHVFCYFRLSKKRSENDYEIIGFFEARAKRIAATYARFYLETEEGGDPSKKGRYYWMALGAFASKTVYNLLDTWQVENSYLFGYVTPFDQEDVANGLAKGNFWLFVDVAAWHWFYSNHPEDFREGMACELKRSATDLEPEIKQATYQMRWAEESLPKIRHFKPSEHIIKGFDKIIEFESAPEEDKRDIQFASLVAIAYHEQGAVLQPLIYDDPDFSYWTEFERNEYVKFIAPTYQLVFSHKEGIENESERDELTSVAPDDLIVENFESRMGWILEAGGKFHKLMHTRKDYMENELKIIAGWVNEKDAWFVY